MESRLIPTPRSLADIDLRSREVIGRGWGKIERFIFRHRRFGGEWSREITRDVYTIAEVVNVLPYDPALDAVVLIEQFRTCGLVWARRHGFSKRSPVSATKEKRRRKSHVARRKRKPDAASLRSIPSRAYGHRRAAMASAPISLSAWVISHPWAGCMGLQRKMETSLPC